MFTETQNEQQDLLKLAEICIKYPDILLILEKSCFRRYKADRIRTFTSEIGRLIAAFETRECFQDLKIKLRETKKLMDRYSFNVDLIYQLKTHIYLD